MTTDGHERARAQVGPAALLPVRLESVRYEAGGRVLLDDLDLEIQVFGRSFVLGPNGAGKSLLLRILHGLIEPSAGRVCWATPELAQVRAAQAMVFQRTALLRRSVAGNVRYALAARGVRLAERKRICEELLARAGLGALASQAARTLSGGEQQRVAIVRAWAVSPALLLLDEPTANLDPNAARAVEGLIQTIHESGTKIVMTTHDLGQAHRLADDVIFLHRGRCLERALAKDFFEAPASGEARAFLAGELLA